ncbi:MAG: nitroreductase family protein [Candidatus Bathyarchaeia archaeon]|nr:nitroreductase family protein [Candidatus Bathyarchaeota archaeon]
MDLFEVIEKRRSIRKFKHAPIPNEDLKKILEAGRLAPSGGNRQPWRFIVVRNSETKRALAVAASNQMFIADADVVVVALGDPKALPKKLPYKLAETRIPYKQDPMIAVEHMVLAATDLGYGTCWIGAFNEEDVKKILKVPEDLAVIALLPIGVPAENPPPRPRKAFNEVFFGELYGAPLEL